MICLALGAPPALAGITVDTNPWFTAHTFQGSCGCLAIRGTRQLRVGDSVAVFDIGMPFAKARITSIVDPDSAKQLLDQRGIHLHDNVDLWDRFACYRCLRGDPPASLAHYELFAYNNGDGEPVAFTELPASALVLGGDAQPIREEELGDLARKAASALPRTLRRGASLRAGRRYRSEQGEEVLELFLGVPASSKGTHGAPIDSVEIFHLFLNRGRVLGFERFDRVSGQEEHVDIEPPQLDVTNWFETSVGTLGFLSLDGGASWFWINADVGFEGIDWRITRLAKRMPPAWSFYLYTYH